MRKKRKRKPSSAEDGDSENPKPPAKAPAIGTAFGPLLERAGVKLVVSEPPRLLSTPGPKPASLVPEPPRVLLRSPHAPGEIAALNAAYRGVQPIARPKRGRARAQKSAPAAAPPDPEDLQARERLAALVAGGVRFELAWDEGTVTGLRRGVSERLARRLRGAAFAPEATLDLHGLKRTQVKSKLQEFVRSQHRRGARHLLVVVGKGLHSDDGQGVLAEAAVEALTEGVAAPLVAAFASADPRHGGRGALAVLLG